MRRATVALIAIWGLDPRAVLSWLLLHRLRASCPELFDGSKAAASANAALAAARRELGY